MFETVGVHSGVDKLTALASAVHSMTTENLVWGVTTGSLLGYKASGEGGCPCTPTHYR